MNTTIVSPDNSHMSLNPERSDLVLGKNTLFFKSFQSSRILLIYPFKCTFVYYLFSLVSCISEHPLECKAPITNGEVSPKKHKSNWEFSPQGISDELVLSQEYRIENVYRLLITAFTGNSKEHNMSDFKIDIYGSIERNLDCQFHCKVMPY